MTVARVRHIMSREAATWPAGASSHAPPALRLVPRPETAPRERPPRSSPARSWPGFAVSAVLHAVLLGAVLWQTPGSEPSAATSVEVVFWAAADTAEAASGDAHVPDEDAAATVGDAESVDPPPDPPEPPVAEAPPPEPVTEAAAGIPVETQSPQKPTEVAAIVVPPPPRPRPAFAPVRKVEPKRQPQEPAPPPRIERRPDAPASETGPAAEAPASAPTETTQIAAARAASAVPQPAGEVPVIHQPRYREPPTPVRYPARALDLNQQGTVVVRALVAPDGTSGQVVVWRSSGYTLLDAAAVRAVRGWAFEPASIAGRKIASWVEVPVRFAIR